MDALIPRAPHTDPKSCEDTGWMGQPLDAGATGWAQPRGTAASTPARPSVPEPTVRICFFKVKSHIWTKTNATPGLRGSFTRPHKRPGRPGVLAPTGCRRQPCPQPRVSCKGAMASSVRT